MLHEACSAQKHENLTNALDFGHEVFDYKNFAPRRFSRPTEPRADNGLARALICTKNLKGGTYPHVILLNQICSLEIKSQLCRPSGCVGVVHFENMHG